MYNIYIYIISKHTLRMVSQMERKDCYWMANIRKLCNYPVIIIVLCRSITGHPKNIKWII